MEDPLNILHYFLFHECSSNIFFGFNVGSTRALGSIEEKDMRGLDRNECHLQPWRKIELSEKEIEPRYNLGVAQIGGDTILLIGGETARHKVSN